MSVKWVSVKCLVGQVAIGEIFETRFPVYGTLKQKVLNTLNLYLLNKLYQ
jgi:hypothetical protein